MFAQILKPLRCVRNGGVIETPTPVSVALAQRCPWSGRVETVGSGEGDGVGARERAGEGAGEERHAELSGCGGRGFSGFVLVVWGLEAGS